jgi:hypothetical protein
MIGFNCGTRKECEAYNTAIRRVLEKECLTVYHQFEGRSDNPHAPSYHTWEIWERGITKEYLEKLLPKIEKEAQELLISIT